MSVFAYLLDTNVLAELIRNPSGATARRLAAVGEQAVGTSIIVACELRFGAAKRRSAVLSARVEQLLGNLEVAAFDDGADRRYAELRAHLEASGEPIGPNHMLIAAHALDLCAIVVTNNTREFSRVPGLAVEDWLAPTSQ